MIYKSIADSIIGLKKADLQLRNQLISQGVLGKEGYNAEMQALHQFNAYALQTIMDKIGYPSVTKVGIEASDAAWLVIQHAIGQPDIMMRYKSLLAHECEHTHEHLIKLAYLTDRILVLQGKRQRYGTQYDWDRRGILTLNEIDDRSAVDNKRIAIGLNTVAEQTEIIRNQARSENQEPPADYDQRKKEMNEWRKASGWIK